MTFDTDNSLSPDDMVAAMAGDHGDEAQFEQLKIWVPQYVALHMSGVHLSGGAGVAVTETLSQTRIYEP